MRPGVGRPIINRASPTSTPPGHVFAPSISPDGKQVAYIDSAGAICLIGTNGGSPPTVVEKDGAWPHWSPDGNGLVFMDRGASPRIHFLDLRTGTNSQVPEPAGVLNPQFGTQEIYALKVKWP